MRIFLLFNQLLYKILGPERSTRLAYSWLGRVIKKFLLKQNKVQVFKGKEGINLKLSKKEALELGFYYLGVVNPRETEVLKKILSQGDVFIDVGAYKDGWHSLLAARLVGKQGKVYAFEPHPEFFKRLKENIRFNKLTNIRAERLALSDKKGKAFFYEAEESSSFFKKQIPQQKLTAERPIIVQTITLDSYLRKQRIRKVRLVKIDVEGAEMRVLKGAKKLLSSKTAPCLMIEVVESHLKVAGSSKKEFLSFLHQFGYRPCIFTARGLRLYRRDRRQPTRNLFFTKKRKN